MSSPFVFAQAIAKWQLIHGRHDLPWQNTTDAYRIWLSEIMLQQTQVVTVMSYYTHFINKFPTVQSLASAQQDEVLALWTGLGYYSRARNLHACAKTVVTDYAGEFPHHPELLVKLKGIGASTAAAIAVFAYGYPATILDGNVKRIISRVFGIKTPASAATDKLLWEKANTLLICKKDAKKLKLNYSDALRIYTQGLMDLGATLCTRRKPHCSECPMQTNCYARINHLTDSIPAPKNRTPSSECDIHLFIYVFANKVWLEKRPSTGIWAGLYSFPEFPRLQTEQKTNHLASIRHILTHRILKLHPHVIHLDKKTAYTIEHYNDDQHGNWFNISDLEKIGLPKPILKLIKTTLDL